MAVSVTTRDGVTFNIPEKGDPYGLDLTNYLVHLSAANLSTIVEGEQFLSLATVAVANGDTVSQSGRTVILLTTANTAVTLNSTTPLSASTKAGKLLHLMVTDNGSVTLTQSGNVNLRGHVTLNKGDVLTLVWDGTTWWELARNA